MAAALTQAANDKQQLVPMLKQVEQNLGRKPEQASADAGYFSEAAVTDEKVAGIELPVAAESSETQRREPAGSNCRVSDKPTAPAGGGQGGRISGPFLSLRRRAERSAARRRRLRNGLVLALKTRGSTFVYTK